MRFRRIAGTVVGAAAACLVFTAQASAAVQPIGGWDHIWTTTDAANGGTLYVEEHGDIVELCDTAADGLAPRALIEWAQGATLVGYDLTASGGNGTCVVASAADGGVHDIPEGVQVTVEVGLGPNFSHYIATSFVNDH